MVGYLPRDDAHRYHPVLSELVGQGLQPQVPCHLWVSEWEPADWEGKAFIGMLDGRNFGKLIVRVAVDTA